MSAVDTMYQHHAGYATKMVIPEATVSAFTEQTLASFKAGDNAPGFPQTAQYDAAGLAAANIVLLLLLLLKPLLSLLLLLLTSQMATWA